MFRLTCRGGGQACDQVGLSQSYRQSRSHADTWSEQRPAVAGEWLDALAMRPTVNPLLILSLYQRDLRSELQVDHRGNPPVELCERSGLLATDCLRHDRQIFGA